MMWIKFVIIGMLSFSAISILTFQSVEAVHAFIALMKNK